MSPFEAEAGRVKPHRAFDPRRLGRLETDAWVGYYRREWLKVFRASVGLTRHMFGMPWPATLLGAWYVLRANRQWAPYPDNDADGARATMERFYGLVRRCHHERFDPHRAAELEVEWWRVHRANQHGAGAEEAALVEALTALYAYVYGAEPAAVRAAAEQRALAMRHSDRWVREGCDLASGLIDEERAALVRSYAVLLGAVHHP